MYKVDILDLKEKTLIKEIVKLFLEGKHYAEISDILNQDIEYVKYILNSQVTLRKIYNTDILEQLKNKNKEEQALIKQKEKEEEYAEIMDKLVYYVSESLYTYIEIGEIIYVERERIRYLVKDVDYIISRYGKETYEKMMKMNEIRKKFPKKVKYDYAIIKDPRLRKLVRPDLISVKSYQHRLLEKVAAFFENNGHIQMMIQNGNYLLNEVNASLNDPWLKENLLEEYYQKLQTLLRVDEILTQNKIEERKIFLGNVLSVVIEEQGDIVRLEERLKYPRGVIERILNDSFIPVFCKTNNISLESIKLVTNEETEKIKIKEN